MKRICPYCGACRTQTTGGEKGNPFDRRPEITLCLECGRRIPDQGKPSGLFSDPTARGNPRK